MIQNTFLGATKLQFGLGLIILMLLLVTVQGFAIYQNFGLAQKGAETHLAVCAYKADLNGRYQDTLKFLALSHAQKVAQYGTAVADIPESTLRQSATNEKSAVDALADLNCP